MGDLNELQAAGTTKIVGSDASGVESNPWAIDVQGSGWVILRDASGGFLDPRQIRALTNVDVVTAQQGGVWNITNITGTVSLPTGASTSALQTSGNASLTSLDTKTPTLGQKNMAGSRPVVLASDQSAIPVSQSGAWTTGRTWVLASGTDFVTAVQGTSPWVVSGSVTANQGGAWNITNITGTVSLPTGASTAALQTSGNASLASLDAKMPTLGQKNMAGSSPVVIASDQSQVPVSDVMNAGGISGTIALTTTAIVAKVGATNLVGRKMLQLQGRSSNIVWGYTNADQSFTLANNEKAFLSIGPNTNIWIKVSSGTGNVAIGEVA